HKDSTVPLHRAAPAAGGTTSPGTAVNTTSTGSTRLRIVGSDATSVTVALTDGASAAWTWDGGSATGASATITLPPGQQVPVTASRTIAAATGDLHVYYRFDHPGPTED